MRATVADSRLPERDRREDSEKGNSTIISGPHGDLRTATQAKPRVLKLARFKSAAHSEKILRGLSKHIIRTEIITTEQYKSSEAGHRQSAHL